MSNRLDKLISNYTSHISIPWQHGLANAQRVLFAVYHREDELKLRARLEDFRVAAETAGHVWLPLDITNGFPEWMAGQKYRDDYFEDPDLLASKYKRFAEDLLERLQGQIAAQDVDEHSVVALIGCGTLFGLISVAGFVEALAPHVPGRLLVFFPGEHIENTYRLLDARDGWGYHATPLTSDN